MLKKQVRLVDTEFRGLEYAGLDGSIVDVIGWEPDRYGDGVTVVDVLYRSRPIELADYELVDLPQFMR